jgi:hypothetical protein
MPSGASAQHHLLALAGNTSARPLSRGDVSRYIDGRFNHVSQALTSNIDRSVSTMALDDRVSEGYRVLTRLPVSRSIDNDSVVLFVGRRGFAL